MSYNNILQIVKFKKNEKSFTYYRFAIHDHVCKCI